MNCAMDPDQTNGDPVETDGKDTCQGDSGGPMTWTNPDTGRVEIVGVVSFGFGCAGGIPGVYAQVTRAITFIKSYVAAAGNYQGGCIPV